MEKPNVTLSRQRINEQITIFREFLRDFSAIVCSRSLMGRTVFSPQSVGMGLVANSFDMIVSFCKMYDEG